MTIFRSNVFILFVLSFIIFTDCVDFMMIMPLGDQLMRQFNITPGQFALLVSSYAFSAGLSAFAGSLVLDLFDRRKALIYVYFGFSMGTTLCGFVSTYEGLLISRFVTGAFGGLMGALVISIVSDLFTYENRGRALGVVMSAFSVASVAGIPLGLLLAQNAGWFMPYRIVGGLAFLCLLLIPLALPSMKGHIIEGAKVKSPFPFIREVVKDKNQVMTLLMIFFLIIGHFMVVPFIPAYLVRNVGFRQQDIQYVYIVGGIVTLITSPIVGWLTDKWGAKRVFSAALLLSLIPVSIVTHLRPASLGGVLVVTAVFFIFANARNVPSNTMASAAVLPEFRGSFMSLRSAIVELASGSAAAISGLIVVQQTSGKLLYYNIAGYVAISCSLISLYFAMKVQKVTDN